MKQKDWFWCGTLLFALMMFVSLQGIQRPPYAGIAGGLCALAATVLFGCGLRADAQEKSARESKREEEKQQQQEAQSQACADCMEKVSLLFHELKEEVRLAGAAAETGRQVQNEDHAALLAYLREWFNAQQGSYAAALEQIRENIATVTGEIQALCKTVSSESQSHSAAFAHLSKDVGEGFELNRTQLKKSGQSILDSLLEQHTALKTVVERQEQGSASYYKFMIDQPWNEIKALSETIQSMADQLDSMLDKVDAMKSDAEQQVQKGLDQLKEDSELLREKLQSVCTTLETQGQAGRTALDRVMQGYSDVTAQDIEVLTTLVKGGSV